MKRRDVVTEQDADLGMDLSALSRGNVEAPWRPVPPFTGVNLGGWFVLEPWMQRSLFEGTGADDEYGLLRALGPRASARLLARHRNTYITRDDLRWLLAAGVNAVRVPVGYWVLEDDPPFLAAGGILEEALSWCDELHIAAVVDLHGLPGGQSSEHHTGRAGRGRWSLEARHRDRSLDVVEALAHACASHPSIAALELVNEPAKEIPAPLLQDYFEAAYQRVRRWCGPEAVAVAVTAFPEQRLAEFRGAFPSPAFGSVVTDVHYYQCFGDWWSSRTIGQHLDAPQRMRGPEIRRESADRPLMIGEWSLRLPWSPRDVARELPPGERDRVMREFARAQLDAYSQAWGHFFWTYRAENEPEWSFRESIERGWIEAPIMRTRAAEGRMNALVRHLRALAAKGARTDA